MTDGSSALLTDGRGRALRDLRVSVTDRCNFRCGYCMPREHFPHGHAFLPREQLLRFEEIARFVRVASSVGVRKVRLTGGEPLLRAELPRLVALLSGLQEVEVTLTTNGSLLARHAAALADAGLRRVTVSLDALEPQVFRAMSDSEVHVEQVLEGIEAAQRAGLAPLKVNAVIRRGMNDHQIVPLAAHFKGSGISIRFIEYMDVGITNGWRLDQVVSGDEMVARIDAVFPLQLVAGDASGEVARRYRYRDGSGEVGVITSVSKPFCSGCSRLRLSSDGQLYTCLFATQGHDLRALLRGSADDAAVHAFLCALWGRREDRYSELRSGRTRQLPRVEMSYIGG